MAVVLSGGGARGAYEVGVLSYVYDDLARALGRVPPIDILCGTSVGAINACILASHMSDPVTGVRRLVDLWTSVRFENMVRFTPAQMLQLPRLFRGGTRPSGIFDARPLVDLITREITWRRVARAVRHGLLRAISVSATEIATGRTVHFVDTNPDASLPGSSSERQLVLRGAVGPQHALASASIPLLFPPVRIGSTLYCDGGLRQNTPIWPALRLGAERILVVGLSQEVRGAAASEDRLDDPLRTPGAPFFLGKLLNAFLLDHVQADLDLLNRINRLLRDGETAFGPDFAEKISAVAHGRGRPGWRRVDSLVVRPSQDIGRLAGEHLRKGGLRASVLTRRLLALLDPVQTEEADLWSYLLFDGSFARKLIDLGRADAAAQRERLQAFLAD